MHPSRILGEFRNLYGPDKLEQHFPLCQQPVLLGLYVSYYERLWNRMMQLGINLFIGRRRDFSIVTNGSTSLQIEPPKQVWCCRVVIAIYDQGMHHHQRAHDPLCKWVSNITAYFFPVPIKHLLVHCKFLRFVPHHGPSYSLYLAWIDPISGAILKPYKNRLVFKVSSW